MKKSVKKTNSSYTEDWIPISSISNGTIILNNKYKVTGVKIKPRNIFILDQNTQDNIIIALKNFFIIYSPFAFSIRIDTFGALFKVSSNNGSLFEVHVNLNG